MKPPEMFSGFAVMMGFWILMQGGICAQQGAGSDSSIAIPGIPISMQASATASAVRNLQGDRWEEVVLFHFDTFFNIINRGIKRIFCDLNGRKFILTTAAAELSGGDNIFLIPTRDTVIIDIARYVNPASENSLLRLLPQGSAGSDADIVISDASGKLSEEVDFILDLTDYPELFGASQNFPNPFNSTTVIRFTVPENYLFGVNVQLIIYNTLGQKVRQLLTGQRFPGTAEVLWDGTDDRGEAVSSGVYIYQLILDKRQKSSRMVLLR